MYEWVGYLASVLVAVSITMKGGLIFRILNLAGSVCFLAYSILIKSNPVIMINIYGIGINIFYIIRIIREKIKKPQESPAPLS